MYFLTHVVFVLTQYATLNCYFASSLRDVFVRWVRQLMVDIDTHAELLFELVTCILCWPDVPDEIWAVLDVFDGKKNALRSATQTGGFYWKKLSSRSYPEFDHYHHHATAAMMFLKAREVYEAYEAVDVSDSDSA